MLQRLCAADIVRIGQHEASSLVHLAEGGALIRCRDCHDYLPAFVWLCDDMHVRHVTLVRVMNEAAVLWCLGTIVHAVIADHAGNAQPVVFENRRATLALAFAMLRHVAPRREGIFITEKRQRQDLALLGQTLESLDRDKAIDSFQDRLQFSCKIKVLLFMLRLRPDFEDHCDHMHLLSRPGIAYSVTGRKNVRSSARMNLFSSA